MSTRRTITVRLRLRQLEEIVEALDEHAGRLSRDATNGAGRRQLVIVRTAIDVCDRARVELMERT